MTGRLERVGVEAVVENFDNFKRSIDVVRREIDKTGKAARDAEKRFASGASETQNYTDRAQAAGIVIEKFIGLLFAFDRDWETRKWLAAE